MIIPIDGMYNAEVESQIGLMYTRRDGTCAVQLDTLEELFEFVKEQKEKHGYGLILDYNSKGEPYMEFRDEF